MDSCNRTASVLPRQRSAKACLLRSAGHFLQFGLRARLAKLRRFPAILWEYSQISVQSRLRGGEGGIRTLGTGVSPYNGLANSPRPLPIARNQSVTVISSALSRGVRQTPMHLSMHLAEQIL